MLINPDSFTGVDSIFEQNAEKWGWWHLIVGGVAVLAGFGVFTGNILARIIGVIGATVSAIVAFAWLPIYPIWGVIVIAVDIAVIWALTHGRDIQKAERIWRQPFGSHPRCRWPVRPLEGWMSEPGPEADTRTKPKDGARRWLKAKEAPAACDHRVGRADRRVREPAPSHTFAEFRIDSQRSGHSGRCSS